MANVLCRLRIPDREMNRVKNDETAPLRSPSFFGSAFAIDRKFFYEIGSFDEVRI